MARKNTKAQQEEATAQTDTAAEATEQEAKAPETAAGTDSQNTADASARKKDTGKAGAKTKGGMVDAKLKTRHCLGGNCKEAGETMRMTLGEYERLKKYDRVE